MQDDSECHRHNVVQIEEKYPCQCLKFRCEQLAPQQQNIVWANLHQIAAEDGVG